MSERGIVEKAENEGNGVSQVASDNDEENLEEEKGISDGGDLVKNDSDESETKNFIEVVLSMEDCTVEGDNSSLLTATDNGEDQACEPVSLMPEGEGDDPVDFPVPSSQEVEPDVGVVIGELEGGAASDMDPNNTAE